jgi:hypothetical protein
VNALVRAPVALGATPAMCARQGTGRVIPWRRAELLIIRVPLAHGAVAGAVAAEARREAFIVGRAAVPIVHDAARELAGVAAVAARIFPAVPSQADGPLRNITVAVAVIVRVSLPAPGVYHGLAPVLAKGNNPIGAWFPSSSARMTD